MSPVGGICLLLPKEERKDKSIQELLIFLSSRSPWTSSRSLIQAWEKGGEDCDLDQGSEKSDPWTMTRSFEAAIWAGSWEATASSEEEWAWQVAASVPVAVNWVHRGLSSRTVAPTSSPALRWSGPSQ
jgi:hypothetical protein